jgi:hypothetical protein
VLWALVDQIPYPHLDIERPVYFLGGCVTQREKKDGFLARISSGKPSGNRIEKREGIACIPW